MSENVDANTKDKLITDVLSASNAWREALKNYANTNGINEWLHDLILMHIEETAVFMWKNANHNTKDR